MTTVSEQIAVDGLIDQVTALVNFPWILF
ncbi:hypothetical protein PM8797T_32210 [Gimesia maris DSM 8797]|nr:hypothetical protein PM8797T_32210 [Gimesia maris DSM 8797]